MEIRNWHLYIVFNCAVTLPLLAAKTFSLNEALAAESKLGTSDISAPETTAQRFSLNKALTTDPAKKPRKYKSEKLLAGKLNPSKYNKTHQIKSALKAKKPRILKPLHLRKSLFKNREVHKNDKKSKRSFLLLKNLGLLLDNLLNSEPVDSYEDIKPKQKRHKDQPEERRAVVCKCALQTDTETGESRSYKKATIATETTITTSATPTAINSAMGDFSGIGQNKNLSLLLPRNPPSDRRNSHGHSERSRPALHGSIERDIARHIRTRKYHPGVRADESSAEGNEKITYSYPRNDASSNEHRRRKYRGYANFSKAREPAYSRTNMEEVEEDNEVLRGESYEEHTRETKHKAKGNKAKGEEFVPKYVRRLRRPVSEAEDGDIGQPIQSQESYEESFNHVAFNNTNDKRISLGSGSSSTEAQAVSPRNEDMISLKDLSNLDLALHKSPNIKAPSVTIIDGYSVARNKNGQNKITEKTIHIHA